MDNQSGANGENRTHTPKRERDFKSRASTSSATLAHYFKKYILKWSGIIIKKILFVKTFNKIFFFFCYNHLNLINLRIFNAK